ncbi:MAG: hypothetical protein RIC06_20890 [Cyclobacteriaceae bacterium]
MKTLEIEDLAKINAGGYISGICYGIGAGSVVYTAGIMTNFWNPVGWVSAGFILADVACIAYGMSS